MAHRHRLSDGSMTGAAGEGEHSHTIPGKDSTGSTNGTDTDQHTHTYEGGRTGPPLTRDDSKKDDKSKNKSDDPDLKPAETFTMENVEVFATGTHNGDTYTAADLDEMVRAFNENKKEFRPFLKLGHDREQKLVQRDGFPALGYIDDLRREGEKLMARFTKIPKKIFQILKNGAYENLSSEIYWNSDLAGKSYRRFLSAVSFLGGDMPALAGLKNLDDILALYGLQNPGTIKVYKGDQDPEKIKYCTFSKENKMPTVEELQAKLDEQKRKYEKDLGSKDEKIKQYSTENEKLKSNQRKQELDHQVSSLIKDGHVPKSGEDHAYALLGNECKEYKIGEKKISRFEVLKELLTLKEHAASASGEKTEEGDDGGKLSEDEIVEKLEEYATQNKIDFGDALRLYNRKEISLKK